MLRSKNALSIVAHTVTGLVVPRRDPAALAAGLAHYAADGPARLAAGAAGRQRALTAFRVEDQLDAWEDFHERAVARRAGDRTGQSRRPQESAARVRTRSR